MINIARFSGLKLQQPKSVSKNFKSQWEHFVKATDSAGATCKGSNTSGLLKHLKTKQDLVHLNQETCTADAETDDGEM